jgi:hypothetical protein
MKLRILIFTLCITAFTFSCSEDSTGSNSELSQEQLDGITGLFNLTEYIVNPPQDLNGDEIYSANLMAELDCLSASIILREDLTYSRYYEGLDITFITNDQYAISCGGYITENGTWNLVSNEIILSEEPENKYSLEGTVLTLNADRDLPDFRTQVFVKQ